MWMLLGLAAMLVTAVNLYLFARGKDYKIAMAIGLSLTLLTMCAEYSMVAGWVIAGDWGALEDVVPYIEKPLWFLSIASILLNTAPIFLERKFRK